MPKKPARKSTARKPAKNKKPARKSTARKPAKNPAKNKKPARKSTARKPAKNRKPTTKKPTKPTKKPTKKQKPSKQMLQSRGMANLINRIEGRKVVKVTKKGTVRLSAGQAARDGLKLGSRHCYDGKCKILKKDKNGRAYWG